MDQPDGKKAEEAAFSTRNIDPSTQRGVSSVKDTTAENTKAEAASGSNKKSESSAGSQQQDTGGGKVAGGTIANTDSGASKAEAASQAEATPQPEENSKRSGTSAPVARTTRSSAKASTTPERESAMAGKKANTATSETSSSKRVTRSSEISEKDPVLPETEVTEGNDRVTVDRPPEKALVPTSEQKRTGASAKQAPLASAKPTAGTLSAAPRPLSDSEAPAATTTRTTAAIGTGTTPSVTVRKELTVPIAKPKGPTAKRTVQTAVVATASSSAATPTVQAAPAAASTLTQGTNTGKTAPAAAVSNLQTNLAAKAAPTEVKQAPPQSFVQPTKEIALLQPPATSVASTAPKKAPPPSNNTLAAAGATTTPQISAGVKQPASAAAPTAASIATSDSIVSAATTTAPSGPKLAPQMTSSTVKQAPTASASEATPVASGAPTLEGAVPEDVQQKAVPGANAPDLVATAAAPATRQQAAANFQTTSEAAVAAARAPLTNRFGPYVCNSTDRSLEDARKRLRTAIAQTRNLRQAFTERVYGKYRVCLRPPPETDQIFSRILADPVGQHRKLREEMAAIREEKEIEKKEAGKLNIELAQSAAGEGLSILSTVDNADQLMFHTAGLNLVILPEEKVDPQLLRAYSDRSPVDHVTGQRVKSISQAAATAGEVMLDRTRKAAAMRVERQRRRQLQLLRGDVSASGEAENNYSRLQVLSTAGSSVRTTAKVARGPAGASISLTKSAASSFRKAHAASVKSGRSRAPSSLSANTLLNLNATADELKIESKPSAATIALIARGVGPGTTKSTQQRLRHPHPESLGGRRRSTVNPVSAKAPPNHSDPPEPFLQAYLALTLPPLPATKERLERKPVPVQTANGEGVERARESVRGLLNNFVTDGEGKTLQSVSEISLLSNLRKNGQPGNEPRRHALADDTGGADSTTKSSNHVSPINPSLTLSVLHSLSILGRSTDDDDQSAFTLPSLNDGNRAFCSSKLTSLRAKIVSRDETFTETMMIQKRERSTTDSIQQPPSKTARLSSPEKQVVPLESIRGGGEVLVTAEDNTAAKANSEKSEDINLRSEISAKAGESTSTEATADVPSAAKGPKRKRSDSSPGQSSATAQRATAAVNPATAQAAFLDSASAPSVQGHVTEGFHANATMNAMHLNPFRHMHHPAAGDLAEYLGSLQQQHLPTLMSGATPSQLSALGFGQHNAALGGYSLQDRTAAARAMLLREQQAAALLGGFPQPSASGFPNVGPHAASITSFLGAQGGSAMLPPPRTTTGERPSASRPAKRSRAESGAQSSESKAFEKGEGGRDPDAEKGKSLDVVGLKTSEVGDDGGGNLSRTSIVHGGKDKPDSNLEKSLGLVPSKPEAVTAQHASLIESGRFHEAAALFQPSHYTAAVKCLLSATAAVPIPKGLVLGPLKERLNTPGFKSAGSNSAPPISRDVVAATILVWLWSAHRKTFQQAFEKNGRIDVDPDCKWFVHAAVDTAVRELSLEIADSMARGKGAFADASVARKAHPDIYGVGGPQNSEEQVSAASKKLDVYTASIVNKALAAETRVDRSMNSIVPRYQQYVEYLDEARLGALRAKSQERTLLAALIARKTTMTETFAHAYVSSVVRAGEALGHGRLFEIAQDEDTAVSSMIPYDILTDDSGSWEDPCKPENGFSAKLTGDDLMRRAHARAMIQKSLRRLQERHHISGGTSTYGPFADPADSESQTARIVASGERSPASSVSPRVGGLKRRISSISESLVPPGSGSAPARSWTVYDPRHFCSPLEWDPDDMKNYPYGLHFRGERARSMSLAAGRSDEERGSKKAKRSMSLSLTSQACSSDRPASEADMMLRSTNEIEWADVAAIFQRVEVPRKSRTKIPALKTTPSVDRTIFAPFCRQIEGELSNEDDESETEEDLSEETVLARHQVVLDEMKAKLSAYLEARKKQQEKRKNRNTSK